MLKIMLMRLKLFQCFGSVLFENVRRALDCISVYDATDQTKTI